MLKDMNRQIPPERPGWTKLPSRDFGSESIPAASHMSSGS
jgi:hypothetical protein